MCAHEQYRMLSMCSKLMLTAQLVAVILAHFHRCMIEVALRKEVASRECVTP